MPVVGSRVAVNASFRVGGVLTDPTVVVASVKAPNGALDTQTYPTTYLTKVDVGIYRFEFPVDVDGLWWCRFESSGTVESANEIGVQVDPSHVLV